MNNEFDILVKKHGSGNMKYITTPEAVSNAGAISYSGAEMDFKTAPVIIEACKNRALSGLYGYTLADENYLNAVVSWMGERRSWLVRKEWIVTTYGILQALSSVIRAFSKPGDGVIVQQPVYMLYREEIENNDRVLVNNPLIYDNGSYSMDFDNLEKLMADESNKLMVLCNPHNPIGKVWDRLSLTRIAELAKKYEVLVFCDEIFAEVVFDNKVTLPYSSIMDAFDNSILCTSLGKTFNFTGFSHANIIIPSEVLRNRFVKQRNTDHYGSLNPFMYDAVIAAYTNGHEWFDKMLKYVEGNIRLVQQFFSSNLPQVILSPVEGTFLVWINWKPLKLNEEQLNEFLINEAYLLMDTGSSYGDEGRGFTRMNLATPRGQLEYSLKLLLEAARKRGFVSETALGENENA